MKLKLKIKPNKPYKPLKNMRIIAWIQKHSDFDKDVRQIFQFFKGQIKISKLSKFLRYYIVSSENPAIILSLFSSIQDLIPEIYFNMENFVDKGDVENI